MVQVCGVGFADIGVQGFRLFRAFHVGVSGLRLRVDEGDFKGAPADP